MFFGWDHFFSFISRCTLHMSSSLKVPSVPRLYNLFTRRMQSLDFYSRLLGPVSDHDLSLLINRVSKERALHQVI